MRDPKYLFMRLSSLSKGQILEAVLNRSWRRLLFYFKEARDVSTATWTSNRSARLRSHVSLDSCRTDTIAKPALLAYLDEVVQHRFDLFGSGWINANADRVAHLAADEVADGAEDDAKIVDLLRPAHRARAQTIRQDIGREYRSIDWQRDGISGYRWSERSWYRRQTYGDRPGVDIKFPWELARMQHLPRLAIGAKLFPQRRRDFVREFKNQTLDFISMNPPRMGVNWFCAMDVAIRIANLLLAFDLITPFDEETLLDDSFRQIFTDSVQDHATHLWNHLENHGPVNTNHYLANLAGLLIASVYLDGNDRVSKYRNFAIRELKREFKKQFYRDGSNFEASSAYHALSTEIMTYAFAFAKSHARRDPSFRFEFGKDEEQKLFGAATYLDAFMVNGRRLVQMGDNDSGRFFRLSLAVRPASTHDEDHLNYGPVVGSLAAWFSNTELDAYRNVFGFEASLVEQLNGSGAESARHLQDLQLTTAPDFATLIHRRRTEFEASSAGDLRVGLQKTAYPDAGVFFYRGPRIYMSLFAGGNGQGGRGGHCHNDRLGFELWLDDRPLCVDPGTLCYTADAELRNLYRSTRSHFVPDFGVEQNRWWTNDQKGLFSARPDLESSVILFEDYRFMARVKYRGFEHVREVRIEKDKVVVIDSANQPFTLPRELPAPTLGYGRSGPAPFTIEGVFS